MEIALKKEAHLGSFYPVLAKLLKAANQSSALPDDSPLRTNRLVRDLQDMLSFAWKNMPVNQKLELLTSDLVSNIVKRGSRGEFTVDSLVAEFQQALLEMEKHLLEAGYRIGLDTPKGYYWQKRAELPMFVNEHIGPRLYCFQLKAEKPSVTSSRTFQGREDAVVAGYAQLIATEGLD